MTPLFQASNAAATVFDASVVLFGVGEVQQAFRVRRHGVHAKVGPEIAFRMIFFGGIVVLVLCLQFVPGAELGGPTIFVLGATIGWLGILLRWWAFMTLGRLFTTVVKTSADQPVVDRGPYRFVRHPGYTGLIAAFLGCGLMIGNWLGAVISTGLVAGALVYRLRREERALIRASGTAYTEYAAGRARLLPFIW